MEGEKNDIQHDKYLKKCSSEVDKRSNEEKSGEDTVVATECDEYEGKPTEEELRTLRRIPDKIPFKVYTIAFVEFLEQLTYFGTTAVIINFIQQPNPGTPTGAAPDPHAANAQPGALGMGQRASTGLATFFGFWGLLIQVLAGYVADTYFGRYRIVFVSVLIIILGHAIITVAAIPSVMAHPPRALAAFVIGMIIMGFGTGGLRPCLLPLIAEQASRERMQVTTTRKGERVIVDPAITTARIYSWFFFLYCIGVIVGKVSMVYAERFVGFYLAFLLPTVLCLPAIPILWFCRKTYIRQPIEGSVLGPAVKLLIRGTKGRLHLNPIKTYKHLHDGTFWDNLKPSKVHPSERPKWMDNINDDWVLEVRRGFSACSMFMWLPIFFITANQVGHNLVSQAATMSLHGVPNDFVAMIQPVMFGSLVMIFDRIIYPAIRRAKLRFSPIWRVTAGFFVGTACMIWSCVVQYYIYKVSICGDHAGGKMSDGKPCPKTSINVWIQTGSYFLMALSDVFATVTTYEYCFSKAPRNMRSLVFSFLFLMHAVGSALSQAFVSLSADPLLVWNYGVVAVMNFVGGCAYYAKHRGLDKEEDRLNMLSAGHVGIVQVEDNEK